MATVEDTQDVERIHTVEPGNERGSLVSGRLQHPSNCLRVPQPSKVQGRPYIDIPVADMAAPDCTLSDEDRRVAQQFVPVVGAYEHGWIRGDRVVGAQDPSRPFSFSMSREYWSCQWKYDLVAARKEEILSVMLAEALNGIFVHKV